MPVKRTRTSPKKSRTPRVRGMSGILSEFHCDTLSYDFRFPLATFNARKFARLTGLRIGDRWTSVLASKDQSSGYHVHCSGVIESKHVNMTVAYWDGTAKAAEDDSEPFAESMMRWLGSFVMEPSARAFVLARFEKPAETWRARFNLPFKVTMGHTEVVIDGVSLDLPGNPFRVLSGWLSKTDTDVVASVQSVRSIEFGTFEIGKEVVFFNDAIKMLVEPLP